MGSSVSSVDVILDQAGACAVVVSGQEDVSGHAPGPLSAPSLQMNDSLSGISKSGSGGCDVEASPKVGRVDATGSGNGSRGV